MQGSLFPHSEARGAGIGDFPFCASGVGVAPRTPQAFEKFLQNLLCASFFFDEVFQRNVKENLPYFCPVLTHAHSGFFQPLHKSGTRVPTESAFIISHIAILVQQQDRADVLFRIIGDFADTSDSDHPILCRAP